MHYTYQIDEKGVATVTLNRPEVRNAFNEELIGELTDLFERIDQDDAVNIVILTGEGKSFCAGADVNWMKKMIHYSIEENYQDSLAMATMFKTINCCQKPIIGKIHGAALGGGSGLVSVCDYAIASEETIFGFTEVRLGLIPAVISPYAIAKIGESAARATFLSGERFDTAKALAIGLVHEVCPPNCLQSALEERVAIFLKAGSNAQRAAKGLIHHVLRSESPSLMEDTCKRIADRRISPEGQEGMDALLTKRKPKWIKPNR